MEDINESTMPILLFADDEKEKRQEKNCETSKEVDCCVCSRGAEVTSKYRQLNGRPPGLFPAAMSQKEIVCFLSKRMIISIKNNQCDPLNERCQLVESGTATGCGNDHWWKLCGNDAARINFCVEEKKPTTKYAEVLGYCTRKNEALMRDDLLGLPARLWQRSVMVDIFTIPRLQEMYNGFGWCKGEGNELKSLTFASVDRELLCSSTMLASGLIRVKNILMQEEKDIRSSDYVTVGKEFVSEQSVLTSILRQHVRQLAGVRRESKKN